jgi:putative NADPH-quinone reductase
MGKRIAIIQGHPDPDPSRYGHALASAYARGAEEAGHEVKVVQVAALDFPLLRSAHDWQEGTAPEPIRQAQAQIAWAEHLVIVFPLWLGDMPAVLKGFLEQVLRPGFAFTKALPGRPWKKLLKGKSARLVVTMGMPAFFYRVFYRAHSVKSLQRNILAFCGVDPVRVTLIGMIEAAKQEARGVWLARMSALGRDAR